MSSAAKKNAVPKGKKAKVVKGKKSKTEKQEKQDLTRDITEGMQPKSIMAAVFEGQRNIAGFLEATGSTEMPKQFGSKNKKKKAVVQQSKKTKTRKVSPKTCSGCGNKTNDCVCNSSSSSSSSSESSSSSSEDDCLWANPAYDVSQLVERRITTSTIIPFGYDALYDEVIDPLDLPFALNIMLNCPNKVTLGANVAGGFILADAQAATGLGTSTFCEIPSAIILSNLPAGLAPFNGIYAVVGVPTTTNAFYVLLKLNWKEDCNSPSVGDLIEILLGATSAVYFVTTLEDDTQRITLTPTGIKYLQCAQLMHMTVPGRKYCYFDEEPLDDGSLSSLSSAECSSESEESC